jgi:hypothetical protein
VKALSIRQPWAWLIMHASKDVENRDWPTHVRGTIAVHASGGMTKREYAEVEDFLADRFPSIVLPPAKELDRGGLIGTVDILDCAAVSSSPWFFGKWGFVLRNPVLRPFVPCRGQLSFFNVDSPW